MRRKYLIVLIFLIPVFFLVYRFIMVQNVLDEMYYTKMGTSLFPLTATKYPDNSEVVSNSREILDMPGWFNVYYDRSSARNAHIILEGSIVDKKITVQVQLDFEGYWESNARSGYSIWLMYEYSVNNKELMALPLQITEREYRNRNNAYIMTREDARSFMTEHGIDIEMIEEWNQYYLYEKVLADWFRCNGGKSMFSLNNLGNVKIVWDQW